MKRITGLLLIIPGLMLSSFVSLKADEQPNQTNERTVPIERASALSLDSEMVETLLTRGGDPDTVDLRGRTPLMWAAENGRAELANRLINAGADVHLRDWWGHNALSLAIGNNHREVITLLLEHSADFSA
ncbi:MAG: ankyrin repeat domain-containing protein [Magnetococcales bacterium]|nr:ankyrin repeat domain-containing protein [Magnetococcales bacterium]